MPLRGFSVLNSPRGHTASPPSSPYLCAIVDPLALKFTSSRSYQSCYSTPLSPRPEPCLLRPAPLPEQPPSSSPVPTELRGSHSCVGWLPSPPPSSSPVLTAPRYSRCFRRDLFRSAGPCPPPASMPPMASFVSDHELYMRSRLFHNVFHLADLIFPNHHAAHADYAGIVAREKTSPNRRGGSEGSA